MQPLIKVSSNLYNSSPAVEFLTSGWFTLRVKKKKSPVRGDDSRKNMHDDTLSDGYLFFYVTKGHKKLSQR